MLKLKQIFLYCIIGLFAISCDSDVEGCTDVEAYNYNADATTNNNSCLYCEDLENETDCANQDICEWHADHSECEEADHDDDDHDDHMHCEDMETEEDCIAHDECEWHDNHCEDADGDTAHTDADGFILKSNGIEIYRQFQGAIEGELTLAYDICEWDEEDFDSKCEEIHDEDGHDDHMHCEDMGTEEDCMAHTFNEMWNLTVHFLDPDGNEIDYHDTEDNDEDGLQFEISDPNIISIMMEEHDDDHDEEHHELGFELTALAAGSTTFVLKLMHGDHADYTSMPVLVTVDPETVSCNGKQLCLNSCCSTTIYAAK